MNSKHPLGALIASVQEANNWSDQDIAVRATQAGHTLSKSNVGRVRNEPVLSIRGSLLQALAAGLDIPVRQVVQAALQSMTLPGIRDFGGASPEDAIRNDFGLSERDRRMLLSQLEVLRLESDVPQGHDTERGGEHARSAPITQARKDRAAPTLTDETSNDYDTTFAVVFDGLIRSASAEVRRTVVQGLAEGDLVDLLLELLDPLLVEAHLVTRGFLGDHKPADEGVPDRSQFARVARPGVGDNPPDGTTGEESQDPGSDEPA